MVLFLFLTLVCNCICDIATAQGDFWGPVCGISGNYTHNSPYNQDLDNVLYTLTGTNNGFGFYNSTSGQVIATALCRGDVDPEKCRRCVDDATRKLIPLCSNQIEAVGWYDHCFLKYSNRSFDYRIDAMVVGYNRNNVSTASYDQWNRTVVKLLEALRSEAASGGQLRKYASGNMTAPGLSPVYGYVQCTPDLSATDCDDCLARATAVSRLYDRRLGLGIFTPSCVLRYENYSGFNSTWYPASVVTNQSGERRQKRNRQAKLSNDLTDEREEDNTGDGHLFDLSSIQVATNNFSAGNKLGEGGFGPVYKGELKDGRAIAVKRLCSHSGQGVKEFKTEVELIIKLQHKNLVRLLGYCVQGTERLLIYEFMANNSLETFLFDPNKCKELDWAKRANIVIGIAKGLRYLHEDSRLKIVHRDMKASNILLDADMNSKISDFGTAKIFGGDQMEARTNRVVGTYGYMAPEYVMGGLFSTKSDVYSFGVVLLEILSGQRNKRLCLDGEPQNFLSTAWCLWKENKGVEFVDRCLLHNYPIDEALRWINIALLCVQEDPQDRPTMSTVVFMLEDRWSAKLPAPSEPLLSFARFMSVFEPQLYYARFAAALGQMTSTDEESTHRQVI
ncbi:hypothetical protein E3N88_37213 [Mikania micrantha]|uniref:non-specific serine/threonine protein kinase n=1 Tax=Mikania micrantha TaxID=192012 RepID=A0A5N6M8J5_9ASTR|nr:hypothetical protein E3N88_37213 [Mikania micrantha]